MHLTLPVLLLALVPARASAQATDASRALAQDAVTVDTNIGAPGMLIDGWMDLGKEAEGREFDYPKARDGGLDVAFMSIYTSPRQDEDDSALQVANEMIDSVEALAQRHPDRFALLLSPKDDDTLRKGERVLLTLGKENGAPLRDDLANAQFFSDRDLLYLTLAPIAP